ncbi:MAG: hypothetical protein CME45_04765 [Halieaceae bacterium]|nr:hypothetical protein [Halieaceae bacterium]MAI94304.1 hypothetical protein [Halieaceae bacterium]
MPTRNLHSVTSVADNLIQALEKKVNDLIELSRELNKENRALKLRAAELQRERRELLERQRQASEHVENSLARLRSLDGGA